MSKICKNCKGGITNEKKNFCSTFCLGQYYGKLNKGKKYKRHIIGYQGNQTSFRKGERRSPTTEFKKGISVSPKTQFKKGNKPWNIKRSWSEELREKLTGKNSPQWKGGITPKNRLVRNSLKYDKWRKAIYKRDDYTCQKCNQRGGKLNADHIKSFAQYPNLRFELDNGRTLCVPCHKETSTYGGRGRLH